MERAWRQGDIFEQFPYVNGEHLFGVIIGGLQNEKIAVAVISFQDDIYASTAFSSFAAEIRFMPANCHLIKSSMLPDALPAAVRPQLMKIRITLMEKIDL